MSDQIKDAFSKVRLDMDELRSNILYLNNCLEEMRLTLLQIQENQSHLIEKLNVQQTNKQSDKQEPETLKQTQQTIQQNSSNLPLGKGPSSQYHSHQNISETSSKELQMPQEPFNSNNPTHFPAENPQNQTLRQENPTILQIPADFPTHKTDLYGLKSSFLMTSTGNDGVPTDRQTDEPTNSQQSKTSNSGFIDRLSTIVQVVNSLDDLKKEVRVKFKRLTKQEMTVFIAIYQLEEQGFAVDYPIIAQKLNLSESSIRDYTQRILKKGIPLQKTKENNKKVVLSISPDLKKIASLATIMQLREL